jgi:hypothetical protein
MKPVNYSFTGNLTREQYDRLVAFTKASIVIVDDDDKIWFEESDPMLDVTEDIDYEIIEPKQLPYGDQTSDKQP